MKIVLDILEQSGLRPAKTILTVIPMNCPEASCSVFRFCAPCCNPTFMVADEPVSMLDVRSVRILSICLKIL